jgi:hypothetical protein
MTIISKRGKKARADEPKSADIVIREMQIYIIDGDADFAPTPEELENIRKVFENIRKQLDAIFLDDDFDLSGRDDA